MDKPGKITFHNSIKPGVPFEYKSIISRLFITRRYTTESQAGQAECKESTGVTISALLSEYLLTCICSLLIIEMVFFDFIVTLLTILVWQFANHRIHQRYRKSNILYLNKLEF